MTHPPAPAALSLTVPEPEIVPANPWSDDALDRKEIADFLTDIVQGRKEPFVISVDGRWGTGKTFLLKRWRQDLENQGWKAIYYNAWQDDFADDPLLAITGRLSEHFDNSSFKDTARGLARLVPGLLDVVAPLTPFGYIWLSLRAAAAKLHVDRSPPASVRRYNERRAAADDFKQRLCKLGAEVSGKTGQPLVFVIDELDRCRPTFAIQLLERVKHIFGVPNIVFVFGVNRAELLKSLQSVYGEIDAGTYLKRFFDMEFNLPYPDAMRFCKYLMDNWGIGTFLAEMDRDDDSNRHSREFQLLAESLPMVFGSMGLSLRTVEHCVRIVALASRNLQPGFSLYPMLLGLLVAVKVRNPELYLRFTRGTARGGEIIDYFNECSPRRPMDPRSIVYGMESYSDPFIRIEAAFYCADDSEAVIRQIDEILNNTSPVGTIYVSRDLLHSISNAPENRIRVEAVRDQVVKYGNTHLGYDFGLASLLGQIDLYHSMMR